MNILMKAMRWMSGRYGTDEFSRFLLIAGLVISVLATVLQLPWVPVIGLTAMVYATMRGLSRDQSRRMKENQFYLKHKRRVEQRYTRLKNAFHQRKVYRFYTCPECKQKLRVPKGKKKIKITCPACRTQFVKKT